MLNVFKLIRNTINKKHILRNISEKNLNIILKSENLTNYNLLKKNIIVEKEVKLKTNDSNLRIKYINKVIGYKGWKRTSYDHLRVDWRISFKKQINKNILIEGKSPQECLWRDLHFIKGLPKYSTTRDVNILLNNKTLEKWEERKIKDISMTLFYSMKWTGKTDSKHLLNIINVLRKRGYKGFYKSNVKFDPKLFWELQLHDYRWSEVKGKINTSAYLVLMKGKGEVFKASNFNFDKYSNINPDQSVNFTERVY